METIMGYYTCLGLNVFYVFLFTLGYYYTNREDGPLQFLTLVFVPIGLYAFFVFTNLGWTKDLSGLGALLVFTVLVFIGRSMDQDVFYRFRFKKRWIGILMRILTGISLIGVPLLVFWILYTLTSGIVTLITIGVFLLPFLFNIFLLSYKEFLKWAVPFLSKFDLLAVIVLLGYFGWPEFSLIINIAVCAIFALIVVHFIVDARKARGLEWVEVPHHRYYSYHRNVYTGSSTVLLGLAITIAIGATSLLLLKSAKLTLINMGFGVLSYYFLRETLDYYNQDRDLWKKRPEDPRSRLKIFFHYSKNMRKYLLFLLISIVVMVVLPLVIDINQILL